MTKALGKEGSFAEGHPIALGKDFFFKKKILCRGPEWKPSAKIFQKKKNNSLPRAVPLPSAKIFWKNSAHFFAEGHAWRPSAKIFQKKILCRGPRETALVKDSVIGAGAVMAAFLCRVPLQPSVKALPSAR